MYWKKRLSGRWLRTCLSAGIGFAASSTGAARSAALSPQRNGRLLKTYPQRIRHQNLLDKIGFAKSQ